MSLPPHDWHAPIVASIVGAYERARPAVYVEIGVDRGHTLAHVVGHRAPHGAEVSQVHGVDVTLANIDPLHADTLAPSRRVALHETTSERFFAEFEGPADVVFIDGDHRAEAVEADVHHAFGVIAADGVIIVHDTLPIRQEWADSNCGDGWRVIEDLRRSNYKAQVFTVPLFPGLTFLSFVPAAIA